MEEVSKIINEKIKEIGNQRTALLPVLQAIMKEQNYVKKEDMVTIAEALDISAADVYGTSSFYSFIETEKTGKYLIRICKSITCENKGKKQVLKAIEKELQIDLGETTYDKKFTLKPTNCLGLCDMGPAMLINDEPFTELTTELVSEIICEFRNR